MSGRVELRDRRVFEACAVVKRAGDRLLFRDAAGVEHDVALAEAHRFELTDPNLATDAELPPFIAGATGKTGIPFESAAARDRAEAAGLTLGAFSGRDPRPAGFTLAFVERAIAARVATAAAVPQPRSTGPRTVQIVQVTFARNEKRGEDGAVWYLILSPCPDDPCTHVCEKHPRMVHEYERQAFRRGAFGHRPDATPQEIAEDKANLWGWDGDRERPTLTPSFLAAAGRPYRMHSFLKQGAIELCGDSTVVLEPNPASCW